MMEAVTFSLPQKRQLRDESPQLWGVIRPR